MQRCLTLVRRCHAGNSLPGSCASPEPEQPWQTDELGPGLRHRRKPAKSRRNLHRAKFKVFNHSPGTGQTKLEVLDALGVFGHPRLLALLPMSSSMTSKLINFPAFGAGSVCRIAQPMWEHLVKQHLQFASIFRLLACKVPHRYLTRSVDGFGWAVSNCCPAQRNVMNQNIYFSYTFKCKNTQPWETSCESHFHPSVW